MKRHAYLLNWIVIVLGVFFLAPTMLSPLFAQELRRDRHTLLLLHFDGNLTGARGEDPVQAQGVAFESGIFGKGAYFAPGNQVYFSSARNLNSTEGTLEFWIKPRWNGNDGQGYVVLRFGVDGGMYFAKDGANNWRSIFNRFGAGNPEVDVAFDVSAWQANQWHHAAFTWKSEVLKLYVDGQLLAEKQVTVPLNVVNEPTFQLGADFNSFYLDAVIDELRISDIERSAQEILSSFLAAQFMVTNTNDGGPGSLRQALLNANATPGRDVIRFNLPGSGPHTIQPLSALPFITDPVVIDGTSQPGFSGKPIIELDGSMAGDGTNGLHITAGNCTVQGLVINRFSWSGILLAINGSNIIKGNYVGTDVTGTGALGNGDKGINVENSSNNTIGGTKPSERNIVSGNQAGIVIFGDGASGNKVLGNYVGTDVTGNASLFNFTGVSIWLSHNNLIGGTSAAARNVISGNKTGVGILDASGNKVQGNFIGTNANGTTALGNTDDGVDIAGGNNNTICDNVISANSSSGAVIRGNSATGNLVQRNFIGTDKSSKIPLGNGEHGVFIHDNASNNTIGGTSRRDGNVIAFNSPSGATLHSSIGNTIRSNSIFSNASLGIDLDANGVTPNDAGDGDTGANNLQNFPVLTTATRDDDDTIIRGTFNSAPNTAFKLEFFSNPDCDPSNHGEGKKFLGSKKVTTDGSGNANFKVSLDTRVAPGQLITATATDPSNNTSEFSQCVAVTACMGKENQNDLEAAEENASIPEDFALSQNYPNPFNPTTTISFALPEASDVALSIFNTNGQLVKKLVAGEMSAGRHNLVWDATDAHGQRVASGVYLYVIKAGEFTAQKKLVLMK